jgi:hypothetical protein
MKRSLQIFTCLAGAALSATAFAQDSRATADEASPASSSTPVAFVYVSNVKTPGSLSSNANVYAYTAAANGKLTPVTGSPLNDNVFGMGVNGTYLFGVEPNGTTIDSFLMGTKGTLKKVHSLDTSVYNPDGCGAPGRIKIDHSGGFLYSLTEDPDCFGDHFQFYDINKSTGSLAYIGDTDEQEIGAYDIQFTGNDKFAYTPICTEFDHEEIPDTLGFARHTSGVLTDLNIGTIGPKPKESGNNYCPSAYATDPNQHMAALLSDEDADSDAFGNQVIATYSVSSTGKLSTSSTYKNMPTAPVAGQYGGNMSMSPSGKLLAVGGFDGLEIFHFNGASPVTKYKTIFTNEVVSGTYWDKYNHLYVIGGNSNNHGKLWVYTVTPTSITQATGSPYSIPNPSSIIVQNK